MKQYNYKYIYGPVPSWRLGRSLGVDPISRDEKICSFDCVYCQIGKTDILTDERRVFCDSGEIINEIKILPDVGIDYITFSGRGEPTLANNLGVIIKKIKNIRKEKLAVITNSSLIHLDSVQKDLMLADFVVAKLDAPSQELFEKINKPISSIKFEDVVLSLKSFKKLYKGKLALQTMLVQTNFKQANAIASIAKEIMPDEIQINTPLRRCNVSPLAKNEVEKIEKLFNGLKAVSVYNAEKPNVHSLSDENTLKRRGKIK